jgi:peptidoglycan/LPS O-acetylase OafA/YrhL
MEWIGARSYGFYLIHVPAFCIVHEIWFRLGQPAADSALVLASAALVLVLAELNWRLVEQPWRAYGARAVAGRKEVVLF